MLLAATEAHLDTIRAQAYNDTARSMERNGIWLTWRQADEIDAKGEAWLRERLGLRLETDYDGARYYPEREPRTAAGSLD